MSSNTVEAGGRTQSGAVRLWFGCKLQNLCNLATWHESQNKPQQPSHPHPSKPTMLQRCIYRVAALTARPLSHNVATARPCLVVASTTKAASCFSLTTQRCMQTSAAVKQAVQATQPLSMCAPSDESHDDFKPKLKVPSTDQAAIDAIDRVSGPCHNPPSPHLLEHSNKSRGCIVSVTQTTQTQPQAVKNNDVLLFMKGTPDNPRCGFSSQTVKVLQAHGVCVCVA